MNSLETTIVQLIEQEYPEFSGSLISRLTPTIGIKSIGQIEGMKYSKFGGFPIIGNGFKWPKFNGRPLSFIAQIDLSELAEVQVNLSLPKSGILYFFMLTDSNSEYPSLPGQFQVTHIDLPKERLVSLPVPLDKIKVFKETFVEFYLHYTFKKDLEYNEDLDDLMDDIYNDICSITGHNIDGGHQVGGIPFSLQNPVFYWWALKSLDSLSLFSAKERDSRLEIEEREFVLLLQLSFSDTNTDFSEYGGEGMAYFGIKKQDLCNLDFGKSRLVCQNT